jgi:ADP-ribose pyrophosphatase YjhB (NUDIX family)
LANKFNIRVYGLLFNSKQEILITHEERASMPMTKFPGGGLEWGEGIHDALIREFREELNIEIEMKELFYLTDYFQISAFSEEDQLISIYYLVREIGNNLPEEKHFVLDDIHFEWIAINQLHKQSFTFPIDQVVAKKLVD